MSQSPSNLENRLNSQQSIQSISKIKRFLSLHQTRSSGVRSLEEQILNLLGEPNQDTTTGNNEVPENPNLNDLWTAARNILDRAGHRDNMMREDLTIPLVNTEAEQQLPIGRLINLCREITELISEESLNSYPRPEGRSVDDISEGGSLEEEFFRREISSSNL